jgi:hypothetical protein
MKNPRRKICTISHIEIVSCFDRQLTLALLPFRFHHRQPRRSNECSGLSSALRHVHDFLSLAMPYLLRTAVTLFPTKSSVEDNYLIGFVCDKI